MDSGRQDTSLPRHSAGQSPVGRDSAGNRGTTEEAHMYLAPYNDLQLLIWLSENISLLLVTLRVLLDDLVNRRKGAARRRS